jgi:hypothetical protein
VFAFNGKIRAIGKGKVEEGRAERHDMHPAAGQPVSQDVASKEIQLHTAFLRLDEGFRIEFLPPEIET